MILLIVTFGSLFSGIGGFDLGFERAGMIPLWQCEIEPNARKVLRKHWPNVELHNDVKEIGAHNLARVDVLCGGFPCQDVSVAGKRAGLDGKRSGLWFEFHRIIRELEPRTVVIENVPGLLSSNAGDDFAEILRGLAELGYDVAWRTLDAQYDGLAQRRKRVFIVGSLGVLESSPERGVDSQRTDASQVRNGGGVHSIPAQILFDSESLSWHIEPSRTAGQGIARAITRGSSNPGINPPGRRQEDDDNIVIANTLGAHKEGGWPGGGNLDSDGAYIVENHASHLAPSGTARDAKGERRDVNEPSLIVVARTLRSEGADASDDGTKQTLVVAPCLTQNYGKQPDNSDTNAGPMLVVAAFSAGQSSEAGSLGYQEEISPTLRGASSGTNQVPCVIPIQEIGKRQSGTAMNGVGYGNDGDPMFTPQASAEHGICYELTHADEVIRESGDIAPTLQQRMGTGGNQVPMIGVRRLTPIECARLQGFPDDWCAGLSDSAQYRAYGNAVAVPVVEWIGKRIMKFTS